MKPPPLDTEAIRRRIEREYLVVRAPAVLDDAAGHDLRDRLLDGIVDVDVVVDLRDVRVCEAEVADCLSAAACGLREVGATLTLSHLSPPAEAVLACRQDLAVRHEPRRRR